MGGDRGAGDREKRGREVYGRREKWGREAGFPRWREEGEKGKNYATLRNISQSKKCKGAGGKKYRAGTGIKGYGKREVQTPLSPPHNILCASRINIFIAHHHNMYNYSTSLNFGVLPLVEIDHVTRQCLSSAVACQCIVPVFGNCRSNFCVVQ